MESSRSPSRKEVSSAIGWLRGSLSTSKAAAEPKRPLKSPTRSSEKTTSTVDPRRTRRSAPNQLVARRPSNGIYGGPPPKRHSNSQLGEARALDAAALQDHLLRSMKVSLSTSSAPHGVSSRKVSSAPIKRGAVQPRVKSRWDPGHGSYGQRRIRKRWKCARCHEKNISSNPDCRVPVHGTGPNSRRGTDMDDTDLTNAVRVTLHEDGHSGIECYLQCSHCGLLLRNEEEDQKLVSGYKPTLTLAMRRGLVAKPDPKLSDEQWAKIESITRNRGDHVKVCAICQQNFGASEQIILSCSHIFHRKCLLSFERFVKSRRRRCCPICRKKNYQKRVSHAGYFDARHNAATAMQSLFRRYRERIAHDKRRFKLYQSHSKAYNPALKRKYIFSSVQNVSNKLATAVSRREGSVETALALAEKALAASRSVFKTLGHDGLRQGDSAEDTSNGEGEFWQNIIKAIRARGDDDCAICLCELHASSVNERKLAVLNCTHVFHEPCLSAYENFNVYDVQLCPTCRSAYRKRVFGMEELR